MLPILGVQFFGNISFYVLLCNILEFETRLSVQKTVLRGKEKTLMEILKVKKTRALISTLVCTVLLVQLTTFVSIS
jgi:hypothetical protein